MPRDPELKKVMVIGSGPIVIGQAAEFDYAGTQACKAAREEGLRVVLVNSNPATIMTDSNTADRVYIEPLTVPTLEAIIEREMPLDGLIPTLGGQTGLNLAAQLAKQGITDRYHLRLLGTPLEAIERAEDREQFKATMQSIAEPVPESRIVTSLRAARAFAEEIGFPIIVRPAYTLGGTGGGIAHSQRELMEISSRGLRVSMIGQLLLERCLLGWKEIEFEVMRDGADNCITVCSMENLDPMGVHTGDSIVVAPALTLTDPEYQMLRTASIKIIRALGIEGGCNIQFALDTRSFAYYVIEVNPRVSRSSALASKATGYPIARIATKIAVGMRLDEMANAITQKTKACFEPAIDYVVVKVPRWPFDKFPTGDRNVGTQMKATGEVMAIDRTFEAAMNKALRSLEIGVSGPRLRGINLWSDTQLEETLRHPTDERIFAVFEAFRRGMSVAEINSLSAIDPWFLHKLRNMVEMEELIADAGRSGMSDDLMRAAKRMGFSDQDVAELIGVSAGEIRERRRALGINPTYKMVDTCAAEFEAATPYYYSSYERDNETAITHPRRVVVIGAGPIRIGQGIEFDYCSVHSAWALKEEGYQSIIINSNPETVSTDFDTADKLYFEPLSEEDALNIIRQEQPQAVVVQFGGQTAINLADAFHRNGVAILGTSFEDIDVAENRDKFEHLLRRLDIPKPAGRGVTSVEAARQVAAEIGYPVLVRPSYVLGGRAMEIVFSDEELLSYMRTATAAAAPVEVSSRHPILVDKYILGKEAEVDVIADGADALIPGIMEHIERAGVHSGDSMAVCPPVTLSPRAQHTIVDYSARLARALRIKGLMNIQFVLEGDQIYVLEVNPRASRTVPYISKLTGIPMVNVATKVMLGKTLADLGYEPGLYPPPHHYGVKAPVFSFAKLTRVDVSLGPEMKSTGEIMGIDADFPKALHKAMVASGVAVPNRGRMILTVADRDKPEAVPLARGFSRLGFTIFATHGTAEALAAADISVAPVGKISEASANIIDLIVSGQVDLLINTMSKDDRSAREGIRIRRASVEHSIPCLTSLDTAQALLTALSSRQEGARDSYKTIDEYLAGGSAMAPG